MIRGVALPESLDRVLTGHLIRGDGQEDLAFACWFPSGGAHRETALLHHAVLPSEGDRFVHGNVEFSARYFERALGEALVAGAGLAFMHSHPGPGWQNMSSHDKATELQMAGAALGATGLPLVGMTVGSDGFWSARFWIRVGPKSYDPVWCESVRAVGDNFRICFAPHIRPPPRVKVELSRTVSTWGQRLQAQLARARVGIVGLGSVGSLVAEGLARMGVEKVMLMDFDRVERVNLDRILHASRGSARCLRPKAELAAREYRKAATADKPEVIVQRWSVCEPEGFKQALDCDVLFSCVDRPWPRQVMNFIAFAHLIPVIDGGLQAVARSSGDGVRRADWFAHTVTEGRRCMECLGQFDPGLLAADRSGLLDDPTYIAGLPPDHPGRRNENVFAFSMNVASLELLQFLSAFVLPGSLGDPGDQAYHFVPATFVSTHDPCKATCPYPPLLGRGDRTGIVVTGKHKLAEQRRARRRTN
jgi:molybdopterin-synthase adenylyltransferase